MHKPEVPGHLPVENPPTIVEPTPVSAPVEPVPATEPINPVTAVKPETISAPIATTSSAEVPPVSNPSISEEDQIHRLAGVVDPDISNLSSAAKMAEEVSFED